MRILLCLALLGCDDDTTAEDAEPEDAAPMRMAVQDAEPEAAVPPDASPEDAAPDAALVQREALVLDLEMRHPHGWSLLEETLEDRGYDTRYRRWFPHFTAEDSPDLVVLALGRAPAHSVEQLRPDSLPLLQAHVERGGGLILLGHNGWADAPHVGGADRRLANALLKDLEVSIAIEANTLIGDVRQPMDPRPPLHESQPWSYVGPLEWTLQLPTAFIDQRLRGLAGEVTMAAGWSPGLACEGGDITVIARAHAEAIVWETLEGQLELPGTARPIAAMKQAGAGAVAVASRSLFELPRHSARGGDKPILEAGILDGTVGVARALVDVLVRRLDGEEVPTRNCSSGMLNVRPGATVTDRPLAPVPAGLPAAVEPAGGMPARPSWFRGRKGRVVYSNPGQIEVQGPIYERAAFAGFDAAILSVDGDAIRSGEGFPSAALAAVEADLFLYLGSFWKDSAWGALQAELGPLVGAYGDEVDAPPPLADRWWTEVITPLMEAAARSAAETGAGGLTLDMELYGSGLLTYPDGHIFDRHAWPLVVEAVAGVDAGLAAEAEVMPLRDRLAWLVDHGLIHVAYGHLEEAVAERAAALRERVREIADVELAFYLPYFSTSWFYRGLMRGWGTAERPVVVFSYESSTLSLTSRLKAEGIHVRHLGGVLAVRLRATDLGDALFKIAQTTDGHWLFTMDDFPVDASEEDLLTRHDPPDAYWRAAELANAQLAQ